MQAGSVVDLLQQRIGGHYSRNALLSEIRHAQNEILCLPEVPFCRVPGNVYLTTLDSVQVYAALPYRIVSRVFERGASSQGDAPYSGAIFNKGLPSPVRTGTTVSQELDYTFDCDESLSPGDTGCTIRFPAEFNPGATISTYLLDAFIWPVQPISEGIAMALPDQWITTLLYYAVKKRVEESAYGVDIYNDPKFQQMLRAYMTKQANSPRAVQNIRPSRF